METERQYFDMRNNISKLKTEYLNDIQKSVLQNDQNILKITETFVTNLKELEEEYLPFVQNYVYNLCKE